MTYRVLLTGSRTFRDHAPIHAALDELLAAHPDMLLVHGGCRDGADAIGDRWAILRGVPRERHPAEWWRHGRSAGPRRNAEMVERGAEVCAAFIAPCADVRCPQAGEHGSHGASGCVALAKAAGIPVLP